MLEKKIIIKGSVLRPNVFKKFSSSMCGVDKHDWWANKYATKIKAKNGINQHLHKY